MNENVLTAYASKLMADYEESLKILWRDAVFKSSNSKFFSALSLPSFMRDWLVMRFSNSEGVIDKQEVSN